MDWLIPIIFNWLIPIIFGAIVASIAFAPLKRKTGIAVSLFLFVLFWIAWPYHAAYNLAIALRDGDASAIENRVDWEHLRQGLRADFNAIILQNLSRSGSSSASGLAAVLAPAIINQMIDGYITPQGMANLVSQSRQAKGSDENTGDRSSGNRLDFSRIQYAFFDGGPFTFNVQLRNEKQNQEPLVFLLKWDGRWRLNRLILPKDTFANGLDKKNRYTFQSSVSSKQDSGFGSSHFEQRISARAYFITIQSIFDAQGV